MILFKTISYHSFLFFSWIGLDSAMRFLIISALISLVVVGCSTEPVVLPVSDWEIQAKEDAEKDAKRAATIQKEKDKVVADAAQAERDRIRLVEMEQEKIKSAKDAARQLAQAEERKAKELALPGTKARLKREKAAKIAKAKADKKLKEEIWNQKFRDFNNVILHKKTLTMREDFQGRFISGNPEVDGTMEFRLFTRTNDWKSYKVNCVRFQKAE